MIMDPETPKELSPSEKKVAESVYTILENIGEDPSRQGLLKTPERVAKAYSFITQGYEQDARRILRSAMFDEEYSEMVLVKDIEFYSLCEHHMLPFFRQSAYCLHPERANSRIEQDSTHRRCFCSTTASAGTHNNRNSRRYPGNIGTYRCSGCYGSSSFVHANARREQTKLRYCYQRIQRRVFGRCQNSEGVYFTHRFQAFLVSA